MVVPNSAVRLLIFGVAVIGLTTVLTACGASEPLTVSQQIAAEDGGTVSLGGGVTLKIPAGALLQDTTATITRAAEDDPAPDELEGAEPAGAAFNIDLGDQELAEPVTLEIAYDPDALPEGSSEDVIFLAFYDQDKKQWVPAGGNVDQERQVVVIETDHLSWWEPWSWWIDALKQALYAALLADPFAFWEVADSYLGCVDSSNIMIDDSRANKILDGCIERDDANQPETRVINRKVFAVEIAPSGANAARAGFSGAFLQPSGQYSFMSDFSELYSGDKIDVTARWTANALGVNIVSWALIAIPGGNLVPFDVVVELANTLSKDRVIAPVIDSWEAGRYEEAIVRLKDVFSDRDFALLLKKSLAKYGYHFALTVFGLSELLEVVSLGLLVPVAEVIKNDLLLTARSAEGISGTIAFVSNKPRLTPPPSPTPPDTRLRPAGCSSGPLQPIGDQGLAESAFQVCVVSAEEQSSDLEGYTTILVTIGVTNISDELVSRTQIPSWDRPKLIDDRGFEFQRFEDSFVPLWIPPGYSFVLQYDFDVPKANLDRMRIVNRWLDVPLRLGGGSVESFPANGETLPMGATLTQNGVMSVTPSAAFYLSRARPVGTFRDHAFIDVLVTLDISNEFGESISDRHLYVEFLRPDGFIGENFSASSGTWFGLPESLSEEADDLRYFSVPPGSTKTAVPWATIARQTAETATPPPVPDPLRLLVVLPEKTFPDGSIAPTVWAVYEISGLTIIEF
jgi:hypothetical protein